MKLSYFLFHNDMIVNFSINASIILSMVFCFAWENLWMLSYMYNLLENSSYFVSLVYSKLVSTLFVLLSYLVVPSGFAYVSHISSERDSVFEADCQRDLLSIFWIWPGFGIVYADLLLIPSVECSGYVSFLVFLDSPEYALYYMLKIISWNR